MREDRLDSRVRVRLLKFMRGRYSLLCYLKLFLLFFSFLILNFSAYLQFLAQPKSCEANLGKHFASCTAAFLSLFQSSQRPQSLFHLFQAGLYPARYCLAYTLPESLSTKHVGNQRICHQRCTPAVHSSSHAVLGEHKVHSHVCSWVRRNDWEGFPPWPTFPVKSDVHVTLSWWVVVATMARLGKVSYHDFNQPRSQPSLQDHP